MLTEEDDGLTTPWEGRVWLNPPYGPHFGRWLERLHLHGDGIALVFARTETRAFQSAVKGKARAMLLLAGRLTFCHPDGTPARANGGAPSVLIAYGEENARRLAECGLPGILVREFPPLATDPRGPDLTTP